MSAAGTKSSGLEPGSNRHSQACAALPLPSAEPE
jgi:hypothetical protein